MRVRKHIIFILTLFACIGAYSQKVDDDALIAKIKNDVAIFFVGQGVLEKGDSPKNVFVTEIIDDKVLGYNTNGIYGIGVFQSHSRKHILIKENTTYKIYDLKHIDQALKAVIDYSLRHKLDDNKMLTYIKNVIQKYDDNYNYEYTSIEKKK